MSNCYLCGTTPAPNKLALKNTFTAHCFAKFPESDRLCDRCQFSIDTRANYWNETKGKYSLLYARNWSWLYQGDRLISPVFDGEHEGFPVVKNLATRVEMRNWLLNPPEPPFTMAIAESGQKHILFLAQEAQSKDLFPVQFEMDAVLIRRSFFAELLDIFERLMGLGANKSDIVSGQYKSQFLLSAYLDPDFQEWDAAIAKQRGGRLLELVAHVAQKPTEKIDKPKSIAPIEEIKPIGNKQLSLWG
jgi:hypothetical protein